MKTLLILALALFTIVAGAQTAPNQAVITFSRPTTYTDGTAIPSSVAITYGVYQGVQGQTKTKVASISAVTATINTGLLSGTVYCWQVTAAAGGAESAMSNEACKTFAPAVPGAVTITVQ